MKRFRVFHLAWLWVVAPIAPAFSGEFPEQPDILFYSAADNDALLGDESTAIDMAEVAILDRSTQTYGTFHDDGWFVCRTGETQYFGGLAFFMEFLGSLDQDIDIDALHVDPWGKIAFSTSRELITGQLGTVKDGSVVEFDPSLPWTDPRSLRHVLREDELFSDIMLMSEEDVIFYSVTSTDGVLLGDGRTRLAKSEIAIAYTTDEPTLGETPYVKVPDRIAPMYPNGFAICGQQVVVRFGGQEFFQALGAREPFVVDALHVAESGHVMFSAASDFHSNLIGTVKDGSVVEFNPYVPFDDRRSLRLVIDEDELFADLAGQDNNQDIDAFAIHQGKYYVSTAGGAVWSGIAGEPLTAGDTDVIEYDPATDRATIFVSPGDLFTVSPGEPAPKPGVDIDIDGLAFNRHGEMIFSIREVATLRNGFELTDGALGAYDPRTTDVREYALQSSLFGDNQGAEADISALHIAVGRDHSDCSPRLVAKGPVNNNQDIDGFAVAPDGTYYFSIEKTDAVLNGHSAPAIAIRDGDIIEYNIGTNMARVALAETELFGSPTGSMAADVDALAMDRDGNIVFSVKEDTEVLGPDLSLALDRSSLAVRDAATGNPALYAVGAGELFGHDTGATANLDALHIAEALDATCNPLPGAGP